MGDINFTMPTLGADMDFGIVAKWYIKPGDKVEKGQMVAEIETSKSDIEIESFYTGEVKELLVEEGVKVAVGTPIAVFDVAGVEHEEKVKVTKPVLETTAEKEKAVPALKVKEPVDHSALVITPRAKRLMAQNQVDIKQVQSLKQEGIISGEDISSLLQGEIATPKVTKAEERQQVIAKLMQKSKQTIPHFYLEKEMELAQMMEWLEGANKDRSMQDRYLPAIAFIKVLAMALVKYPRFNGIYKDGHFIASEKINIGLIISLREGGLIAPALEEVDKKTLGQLMTEFRDLVTRAREGKLKRTEMESSTICLTNLGDQGADKVYGVIYPPQVAIVGTGQITKKVIKQGDNFIETPTCNWTLSVDHRVTDGHEGSMLLNKIQKLLDNPTKWAE